MRNALAFAVLFLPLAARAETKQPPVLIITSTGPSSVLVDNVMRGRTPLRLVDLGEGDHVIEVRLGDPMGSPPWRTVVTLKADHETAVNAEPQPKSEIMIWWHDPERGCGTVDNWNRTHRMQDLPGCSGTLPQGASPGEVGLHDVKLKLMEAERLLDARNGDGVAALLDAATTQANAWPADPRNNWARARYAPAIESLRNRLAALKK
jgi:hypothetical protein